MRATRGYAAKHPEKQPRARGPIDKKQIGRARCVKTGRRWSVWELPDGTVKIVREI